MGDTLGFIAIVVGLGAIFGQVLESSGGANALASHLLKTFREKRSSLALTLTGFIIAIPVFFDVGFILFVPERSFSEPYKALIVLAIAAGATILSHVDDSGFWLVDKIPWDD